MVSYGTTRQTTSNYIAQACMSVNDTLITCTSAQGVGSVLHWMVRAASCQLPLPQLDEDGVR